MQKIITYETLRGHCDLSAEAILGYKRTVWAEFK